MAKISDKLTLWQRRLSDNELAYSNELSLMDEREALYSGTKEIASLNGVSPKKATNVRNIIAEIIEAQVDSSIPMPKVNARCEKDEAKAKIIEDYLRNELDRLPFEAINDMDERTTPMQGGDLFLIEWDMGLKTHRTMGELSVSLVHPKQLIPQNGVASLEDMDYFIIRRPRTKEYIFRKYGVNIEAESEEEPSVRGSSETDSAKDMVTENTAYYKSEDGGIGRFIWVNDTMLEDDENYQSPRLKVCDVCGSVIYDNYCDYCGGESYTLKNQDYEELSCDIARSDGTKIPAYTFLDGKLFNTKIPRYSPNVYPFVLRKNVSSYGKFLGDSDTDKIKDQQESIKKAETRINEKLSTGGSIFGISENTKIELNDKQMKVVRFKSPQDEAMTKVFNLQVDTSQDMVYITSNYDSARNIIGITDSFQGRRDETALSGKAKEFSASQTAGRLESKKTMKSFAYSKLFELMFKFLLAYADEPRSIIGKNNEGKAEYKTFNRYDFLEMDEAGEYYWNDEFLFSIDVSSPFYKGRESLWEETRNNLTSGAFGNPGDLSTLVLFWSKMELLHYPGASDTKEYLSGILKKQQEELKSAKEETKEKEEKLKLVKGGF
ncbi:MAG: hypothetical protein VB120_04975 [Lachnospiraceae bacterium]|nr:hypothetical protein [Lachnospiraceae bacterium]